MIEMTTYTCEVCGYKAINKVAVQVCEEGHKNSDKIAGLWKCGGFQEGSYYPKQLVVKFRNDSFHKYNYETEMKPNTREDFTTLMDSKLKRIYTV